MRDLKVHLFIAHSTGGFWPLASTDARQHPLFWASIHCTKTTLGPGLNSYPGINFFLLVLGMNLPSTYCVLLHGTTMCRVKNDAVMAWATKLGAVQNTPLKHLENH